ncbi:unnamed protein product [Arabis nemorensis]|uniref:Uncharacterized protein n=1 Tax=Arabis nemorensis TaxID=586526 RepID=A0A565AV56_9BRAS|nr:unnamed protein product [Arabis nemorensis]
MGFTLSLCRSASRLASSVCGGRLARVRSISSVVNRQAPAAAIDDWISSEQAVLGAIDSEFYGPVIVDQNDAVMFYLLLVFAIYLSFF